MVRRNYPIRFAVVGAYRGKSFIKHSDGLRREVQLAAVCDINLAALDPWKDDDQVRCYRSYEQVLNDPEIDAVCLATPVSLHAAQAIAALEAGKHVLSEVTAAYTLDECWALVRAVEKSGLTYMMAENYCFSREALMVQNMVERGVFGDLTYATGSYIHDCRDLNFTADDKLTWRGELRATRTGNTYPTHSLGPVCRWLGINRTDFLKTTATWESRGVAVSHYAERNRPQKTEWADRNFWKHPDTVTTLLRTQNGVLIESRIDFASARPHHGSRHELQGSKAVYSTSTDPNQDSLIWIEDRSPMKATGIPTAWEPLSKYAEEFEHPLWREHGEAAQHAGHGGGDYFTLREFVGAIVEDRPPLFDVYDAVTWSCITPLSEVSIRNGNMAVEVPIFTPGRDRPVE